MNRPVSQISKEQLVKMLEDERLTVIDLRLNWETSTTKIKNAVHEDPRTAAWWVNYDLDQAIVVYCSSPEEKTSLDVAGSLLEKGFTNVRVLKGGWLVWEASNLPVQRKTKEPLPGKLITGVISD
ncbi:MAG: rhodanese-like domain-containing protein [Desulfobacterales bacterium]|jgi:rhodanese-related sulfurtransferase